jgi:hypothetical protein
MTFGGLIRRSTVRRHASHRLLGRRLNRCLVLEPLEGRLCPVLTLTTAGMAAGFRISNFVTDIQGSSSSAFGAEAVAFPDSGGVLVSDINGNVRLLPSDTDGQSAMWYLPSQNYGFYNAIDLTKLDDNIYMAEYHAGKVVQIDDNGNYVKDITTLSSAENLVPDPMTSRL